MDNGSVNNSSTKLTQPIKQSDNIRPSNKKSNLKVNKKDQLHNRLNKQITFNKSSVQFSDNIEIQDEPEDLEDETNPRKTTFDLENNNNEFGSNSITNSDFNSPVNPNLSNRPKMPNLNLNSLNSLKVLEILNSDSRVDKSKLNMLTPKDIKKSITKETPKKHTRNISDMTSTSFTGLSNKWISKGANNGKFVRVGKTEKTNTVKNDSLKIEVN